MGNNLFAPPTKKELKELSLTEGLKQKAEAMTSYTFRDTGRPATPGEGLDSWTGAPVRRAIYEYQGGKGLIDSVKSGWEQAGRDVESAPSGEDIVRRAGVEGEYLPKVLGFGVDVGADVTGIAGLARKGAVPLMGAVKKIGKAEKAFDAQKILSKIDTPEKALALKGNEREAYLKALDEVYGPREQRAQDLGFGERTWYHGTTVPIDEFKHSAKGLSTNAQSAKRGFFFAEDPSTASDYADLAREKGIIREGDNVTTRWMSDVAEPEPLSYNHYGEKRAALNDLSTRKAQEQKRIQALKGWEKAKQENADWLIKNAQREGKTVDEFIAEKTKRIQNPIKPASKKEIAEAEKAYHQSLIDFVKTNDPDYARKILSHDLERATGKERQAILDAIKIGSDSHYSTGQNVVPVRLKGKPHVKNYRGESYRDTTYADEMTKAKESGRDSVLFKNTYDPADPHNYVKQDIAAVFEPNQIRSVNAAFDPRFKDSSNLLAGGIGAVQPGALAVGSKAKNQKDLFAPPSQDELDSVFAPPTEEELKATASPRRPFPGEGLLRGAVNTLPVVGAVGGGLLAGGPTLGAGTLAGATIGAGAGKALENFIEGSILGDDKTRQEIYMEPLQDAAWAGVGEGLGPAVVGGATKGVSRVYQGGKGLLEKYVPGVRKMLTERFQEMPKAGAEAIQEATSRLPGSPKPTEGMLTDNSLRQGMESSLSQSPTAAGQMIRKEYDDLYRGMNEGAETVLREGKTAPDLVEAGQAARKSIGQSVETQLKPAVQIYEELATDAKVIDLDPKLTQRVSNNLLKMDAAKFKSNPAHSTVNMIAEDLSNVKTLAQLRSLKTQVFREMQAVQGEAKYVMGEIYDKLVRAEKSTITRASLQAARNAKEGTEIGKAMIANLKKANKIYRGVNTKVKTLAEEMGIRGVRNHADFARAIEAMPDEKVAEQFWKAKNSRGMEFFKKEFPEAFEYIRKSKLGDIYNKSIVGEEISVTKLLQQTRQMTPQARKMLFGEDGIQVLRDIEKVKNAIPPKMGPSGTPQGQEFRDFEIFSPSAWFNEGKRALQLWVLKNPEKASKLGIKSFRPTPSSGRQILFNQTVVKPSARGLLE